MDLRKSVIMAAAMALLAVGTTTVPAFAANPRVAIVNGIPGRTVDICFGDEEVRSNLKYGRWFQRTVAPGVVPIRFRAASPGRCKGQVLALTIVALPADADLTVVGTKRATPGVVLFPKVVVFSNTLPPAPIGAVCGFAVRHAADVGDVVMSIQTAGFLTPAAPPVWEKADEVRANLGDFRIGVATLKLKGSKPFEDTGLVNCFTGTRLEFILVGTTTRNARLIVLRRATIPV